MHSYKQCLLNNLIYQSSILCVVWVCVSIFCSGYLYRNPLFIFYFSFIFLNFIPIKLLTPDGLSAKKNKTVFYTNYVSLVKNCLTDKSFRWGKSFVRTNYSSGKSDEIGIKICHFFQTKVFPNRVVLVKESLTTCTLIITKSYWCFFKSFKAMYVDLYLVSSSSYEKNMLKISH